MLFQEPHIDYLRLGFRSLSIPTQYIQTQHVRAPSSALRNSEPQFVLAVSNDVAPLSGALSMDAGGDVSSLQLNIPWSNPDATFLDSSGRYVSLFTLRPSDIPSGRAAAVGDDTSNEGLTQFDVVDGAYVHVVERPAWKRSLPSPTSMETSTLADAATRSILLRIVVVDQTISADVDDKKQSKLSTASALRRAHAFLRHTHSSSPVSQPGDVRVISTTVADAYALLQRQQGRVADSALCKQPSSGLVDPTVVMLADRSPTLATISFVDEQWSAIHHATGALALSNPIVLEMSCVDSIVSQSPPCNPPTDSLRVSGGGAHGNSIFQIAPLSVTGQSATLVSATPGNIPRLKLLLSRPEITLLTTPWSSDFAGELRAEGFAVDDPELPPAARVYLSRASSEVARDKVQSFLESKLKSTSNIVQRAQNFLASPMMQSPHGYWTREGRNFLLSVGFSPRILRTPCSKQPHIPSLLRVAAKHFLEDMIEKATDSSVKGSGSSSNAATELRILAEEQIAEYEFIESLVHTPPSQPNPIKSSHWPTLICELLRLLDFPAFALHARGAPIGPMDGVSAALQQEAADFLRQRIQLCPMETTEETIRRRCVETLSTSYLTTSSDVWPEDLRRFLLMLDFLPNEMMKPVSRSNVVSRDIRDLARLFLEHRAEGKDPKLEIARALLSSSSLRLSSRALSPEQVHQIILIGFPFRDKEEEALSSQRQYIPDVAVRQDIQRYLNEYIRTHDSSSSPPILHYKELLYSPFLCNETTYWSKALRMQLGADGFFKEEMAVSIHQCVHIPRYLRKAARLFVESLVRDRLGSLLSAFPDAMVLSFPGCSTLPDDVLAASGNDDTAQSQWSLQDRSAFQKDSMREETIGADALLVHQDVFDGSRGSPQSRSDKTQEELPPVTLEKSSPRAGNDGSDVRDATTSVAYLQLSVFRVDGAVADPLEEVPSAPSSPPHGRASATASDPSHPPRTDLNAFLANSAFAQHQFEHHSIRAIASLALVHDDSTESMVLAASATGCALVDHTWSNVPLQLLSHRFGGLSGIGWTPMLLASTSEVSAISSQTSVHVGIFQTIKETVTISSSATLPPQVFAQPQAQDQGTLAHHPQPSASSAFGAPPPTAQADPFTSNPLRSRSDTSNRLGGFGNPYEMASRSHGLDLSPVPVSRPQYQSTARSRQPPLSVRSRLAMRNEPRSANAFQQSSVPETQRTPPRQNRNFSDVLDITPPPKRGSVFTPFDRQGLGGQDNTTDADILRMIKTAESAAGIKSTGGGTAQVRTATRAQELQQKRLEWDRQRQESVARLRSNALNDEFAPVDIPSSSSVQTQRGFPFGGATSPTVDGVPMYNIAGRRAPPQAEAPPVRQKPVAMSFDMTPPTTSNNRAAQPRNIDEIPVGGKRATASFDDVPVGGGSQPKNHFSVTDTSSRRQVPSPWMEQSRAKEEIEKGDDTASGQVMTARRRMRESLSMSPTQTMASSGPGGPRRRVEATIGLERYATSTIRNRFDDDIISVSPASKLAEPGQVRKAHPWDDERPAVPSHCKANPFGTDDRPPPAMSSSNHFASRTTADGPVGMRRNPGTSASLQPKVEEKQSVGLPPRVSASQRSAPQRGTLKTMTTAERLAAAAARRDQIRAGANATHQEVVPDVVVAVPRGPNPYQQLDDKPIGGTSGNAATSEPQSSRYGGVSSRVPSTASPSTAQPFMRNAFGKPIDTNVTPARPPPGNPFDRASVARPAANPFVNYRNDEDIARQLRQEQEIEAQQQRAADDAERRRRQDQLVQDRLRKNFGSGPQVDEHGQVVATLRQTSSSWTPSSMKSPLEKEKTYPLAEASFSIRGLLAALLSARVDAQALHHPDVAMSAVLRSDTTQITSIVVPPSQSTPHETQHCAVIVIPLSLRGSSAGEAGGGTALHFRLLVRVHNVCDLLHGMTSVPLKPLSERQDYDRRHQSTVKDGSSLLSLRTRLNVLMLLFKESTQGALRLGNGTLKKNASRHAQVLDALCDPHVTTGRIRALVIKFQLSSWHRERIASRVKRQSDQQGQLQRLGLHGKQGVRPTIFTAPLETIDDEEVLSAVLPRQPPPRSQYSSLHGQWVETPPKKINSFHVLHLLRKQRMWLDANNPLMALRSKAELLFELDVDNARPISGVYAAVTLLYSALGASSQRALARHTTAGWAKMLRVYVTRCILLCLWVALQRYAQWLLPILALCVSGCSIAVLCNASSSCFSHGTTPYVTGASDVAQFQREPSDSLDADAALHDYVVRLGRIAAAGHLLGRVKRVVRGDSLLLAILLALVTLSACCGLWGMWLYATDTTDGALTDRDRYLGLPRHWSESHEHQRVAVFNEASTGDQTTLEVHFYTGYLIFAPFHVNPVRWVLWGLYRVFFYDTALEPFYS